MTDPLIPEQDDGNAEDSQFEGLTMDLKKHWSTSVRVDWNHMRELFGNAGFDYPYSPRDEGE